MASGFSNPPDRSERLRRWLDVSTASSPSVTHDGTGVLLVSDASGLPLPYRVSADGGPPVLLYKGQERVGLALASPTDPRAIVSIDAGGNERWQLSVVGWAEGEDRRAAYPLVLDLATIHSPGAWTDDGRQFLFSSNARDPRFFDVYRIDVEPGASPTCIWREDGWNDVVGARGPSVLIARRNSNLDTDLFVLREGRTVHLNPHAGELTVLSVAFGRDGIYAAANPGREFAALVRYRPDGSGHEFLREFAGDVELVRASPTAPVLALSVNRDGWSDLHLVDLATNEDRRVPTSPRGVVANLDWFPDGQSLAYELSSVEGQEVYRLDIERGRSRRLTKSAKPPPVQTKEPSLGRSRSWDGTVIPYWEYAPLARAPRGTIVNLHGGPEAQARPGFAPVTQFLVEDGWRVILPNVRGSTGYGRAFVHLDDVRRRMDAVRDIEDLVGSLVRERKAEPGRIGAIGGSYGGFLVLASLSTYPDLFRAAVDLVGIANWVSFLERTGAWRRKLREAEYGSLENDRAFLEEISPLKHAERIRASLLVVHGRNDPRVPAFEAEQLVAKLRNLGRSVELLMFEDEGHGFARRENRLQAWVRAAEFLHEHLGQPG